MPGTQKTGAGREFDEWQTGKQQPGTQHQKPREGKTHSANERSGEAKNNAAPLRTEAADASASMNTANDPQHHSAHKTGTDKSSREKRGSAAQKLSASRQGQGGAVDQANFSQNGSEKAVAQNSTTNKYSANKGPYSTNTSHKEASQKDNYRKGSGRPPIYGALDLGTNNCRLLLARPTSHGFQIVDAFSRIIRLGEGLSETGQLSRTAMDRTIDALKICAAKMDFHKVSRARLIATEACRAADNSDDFLAKVKSRTGIELEIINQETEAKLAVSGCATLIDKSCDYALIFDIGGGSSELIWLDLQKIRSRDGYNFIDGDDAIVDWISVPVGVVTMAERFNGRDATEAGYRAMIEYFKNRMQPFVEHIASNTNITNSSLHFLGTSGTVTTVAGVHLKLEVYDRQKIDGLWMNAADVPRISRELMELPFDKRAAIPSIGRDRADLVLGGCAILEAMLETWSPDQLRVADRGLREGILAKLMAEDGHLDPSKRWVSLPKKQRPRNPRRARRS